MAAADSAEVWENDGREMSRENAKAYLYIMISLLGYLVIGIKFGKRKKITQYIELRHF
tara:strand:- start:81175 stop:81348 length:174 start_codon:yes stop_codon:yes gene_type:complete